MTPLSAGKFSVNSQFLAAGSFSVCSAGGGYA